VIAVTDTYEAADRLASFERLALAAGQIDAEACRSAMTR